jgi:hypothetical protein
MKRLAYIALVCSTSAFAGGSLGGSGLGKAQLELALSLVDSSNLGALDVPDLGLFRSEIATSDYRRARARLSVDTVTTTAIKLQDGEVNARLLNGGIVNETADTQFVPGPN